MWIIVTTFRYVIDDGFNLNEEVAASLARPGPQCACLIVSIMFTQLPMPPRGPRLFLTLLHNAVSSICRAKADLGFPEWDNLWVLGVANLIFRSQPSLESTLFTWCFFDATKIPASHARPFYFYFLQENRIWKSKSKQKKSYSCYM